MERLIDARQGAFEMTLHEGASYRLWLHGTVVASGPEDTVLQWLMNGAVVAHLVVAPSVWTAIPWSGLIKAPGVLELSIMSYVTVDMGWKIIGPFSIRSEAPLRMVIEDRHL